MLWEQAERPGDQKGTQEGFWGSGDSVLFLDLGAGNTGIFTCESLSSCAIMTLKLLNMHFILQ